jgi:hypothetical protein
MEKLLGKKERQIENKLTEETVQENLKNLASVLKPIPDSGRTNKSMFCTALSSIYPQFGIGLKAEARRPRRRTVAQRQHNRSCMSHDVGTV